MTNFSSEPNNCEVNFFKPSGKWYATEVAVFAEADYSSDFKVACCNAIAHACKIDDESVYTETDVATGVSIYTYINLIAVILNPYHEYAHPIMIPVHEALQIHKNYKLLKLSKEKNNE